MRQRLRLLPAAALLLAAACAEQGITTPPLEQLPESGGGVFSEQITLPELQAAVAGGAVRVEVKLRSATAPLIAREVERDAAGLGEEEKIESRATAVGAGAVTLELGGLQVGYDAATRFLSEGGDTLTAEEFAARVQAALDAGTRPGIEAKRPAPAAPQAPGDAAFLAAELELDDEADEPKLEMNAGAANLTVNPADSSATLTLLGLAIQIRPGQTELEASRPEKKAKARFEGIVRSVDAAAGTLTLLDGRVIRVVADAEIETGGGKLASLAEVATALAAQRMVEAEGRGAVEGGTPPTLVAAELELKVQSEAENVPDSRHLKGAVAAIDTIARTITLSDGRVVRLVAGTHWQESHDLSTLPAVHAALAGGRPVSLDAKVVLEAAGPPAAYIALKLKLKDESKGGHGKGSGDDDDGDDDGDDAAAAEFEGRVTAVSVAAGTVTLSGNRLVRLTATTVLDADGDLLTLQAAADALAAGAEVKAEGEGTVTKEGGTRVFTATRIEFEVEEDD